MLRFIYVCDLGLDLIFTYALSADGKLKEAPCQRREIQISLSRYFVLILVFRFLRENCLLLRTPSPLGWLPPPHRGEAGRKGGGAPRSNNTYLSCKPIGNHTLSLKGCTVDEVCSDPAKHSECVLRDLLATIEENGSNNGVILWPFLEGLPPHP